MGLPPTLFHWLPGGGCLIGQFPQTQRAATMGGRWARVPPVVGRCIVPYQLTVLYQRPRNPAVFDEYYDKTHTPLVVKIPGLRSFVVSRPGPDLGGGSSAYYLVAVLGFDSEDAAQAAMVSPEGSAVLADLDNFAQAGFVAMTGPSTVII